MNTRIQVIPGVGGNPKESDNIREEYDKILAENQEIQNELKRLESLELKYVDLETKYQAQTRSLYELQEKYKIVGLERVNVGRKLLKMEQLEAERIKARKELERDNDKSPQNQALKELIRENELLKSQLAKQEEDCKNAQINITKLTHDKEELMDQLDGVKLIEEEVKRFEITKRRLLESEEETKKLRLQMAMGLPEVPEDRNTLIKEDYEKVIDENKVLRDRIDALEKKLLSLKELKKNCDDKQKEIFQLKQELKTTQIGKEEARRKLGTRKELKAKIAELRMKLADKLPGEESTVRQEMRKVLEENKELEAKNEEIDTLKKKLLQANAIADNNLAELEKTKQALKRTELERDRFSSKAAKATN